MQITFDTSAISPIDQRIIALLAGSDWPAALAAAPAVKEAPAETVAPDSAVVEQVAPVVKKAAPAKKAPKPEPAEEPAPVVEEETPAEAEADAPTMADAVAAATKLVSSGNAGKVKEALASVGAKRVSEVAEDKIGAFLTALAA